MKILLDDCLPVDFRYGFPGFEVHRARLAGFQGKKNGELVEAAEAGGDDVWLTVDATDPIVPITPFPLISRD